MTLPRRRRRSGRRLGRLTLAGDFPGNAQDITEELSRIPAATWDGTSITFGGASGAGLPDDGIYGAPVAVTEDTQPITPPPAAPAADPLSGTPPHALHGRFDTIGRILARGWPHLTEIRCAYPAANHATPIPCGSTHTDPAAASFRDLRRSAYTAGWHLDDLGRMACPSCCQHNGLEYRAKHRARVR